MSLETDALTGPVRTAKTPLLQAPRPDALGYYPVFRPEQIPTAEPAVFFGPSALADLLQGMHCSRRWVEGAGLNCLGPGVVVGPGLPVVDGRLRVNMDPHSVVPAFAITEGLNAEGGLLAGKTITETNAPLLSILGPGHMIWGHWLIDFIPRLAVAQAVLGRDLQGCLIPLPSDTPAWGRRLLAFFCGVREDQIIVYDRQSGGVRSASGLCVPDDLHTTYNLHSALTDFYAGFVPTANLPVQRRLCVSRRRFGDSRSVARTFPLVEQFEAAAESLSFEIIYPESLDIAAQIRLFSGATAVVGEFGSGMHNTLFAPAGCVMGQVAVPSPIQSRIAGLRGHRSVFLLPGNEPRFDTAEPAVLEVDEADISAFFEAVVALEATRVS